ncbi:MAG: SDR family oxidoreductase [Bdellovibrionales bacterium]|nr:SDR family oxidoreductase [Bdellovibrionales bacterium]
MNPLVLITGASNGIGKDMAIEFARRGHDLALVARSKSALEAVSKEINTQFQVQTHSIAMDLSLPDSAKALYEEICRRDLHVEILVNNAGFGELGSFSEMDDATIAGMITLNIHTLTMLCRYFVPFMIQKKNGRIMNVASLAAFQAGPYMSVYYASKAYVLHFTEGLAKELEDTEVTVSALCPGPTHTGFGNRAHVSDKLLFKIPGFQMQSKDVARIGVDGLMKGKTVIIPGLVNKITAQSSRIALRSLSRNIVARLHKN